MEIVKAFYQSYKTETFHRMGVVSWLDFMMCTFAWSCTIVWITIMIVLPPLFFIGFLMAFSNSYG